MENNKNLCVFFVVVVVLYALFVMHLAADSNWHTFSLLFSSPIGDIASFFFCYSIARKPIDRDHDSFTRLRLNAN